MKNFTLHISKHAIMTRVEVSGQLTQLSFRSVHFKTRTKFELL